MYPLGTWFVSGICVWIPCIKETMMMVMMIIIIIILQRIKTKTTYLIDIAVRNTHNLAKTITEKQSKYQEVANEMCAMWKQNTVQVIPIVISSTGVIPKSLSQSLKRLNLHPNIYSFIHSVFCLTTGPTPPPKRFLQIVRSRASSFK